MKRGGPNGGPCWTPPSASRCSHPRLTRSMLCARAHDQLLANFDAREEHVLHVGCELLATWLGQLASAAGPRRPACPKCGVHSLNAVRRRRKPRTVNSRCGTVHIPRVRLTCRGCGQSWLPLQSVLGVAAKQRTSGGLQHWETLLGGLTTFAEAAQLLETLAGVGRRHRDAADPCGSRR